MDLADPSPDVGPLLDVLANKRRRIILRCFEHDNSYSLQTLAQHIVTVEHNVSFQNVSTQRKNAVYVTLYQTHVPRCAEIDLLEYDEPAKIAHRGPKYTHAKRVLDCLTELS